MTQTLVRLKLLTSIPFVATIPGIKMCVCRYKCIHPYTHLVSQLASTTTSKKSRARGLMETRQY